MKNVLFKHVLFQPNLNELPVEVGNTENKENISRKRSLSESNSTLATTEPAKGEGQPATKKVKVVDICLGNTETTSLTDVKVEPFVDGMQLCTVCVRAFVCLFVRSCVCVCVCVNVNVQLLLVLTMRIVQSLDDDSDLPELEVGGIVDKNNNSKSESNSTPQVDNTPTVVTSEVTLPPTNKQPSTNSVDDSTNENDTTL